MNFVKTTLLLALLFGLFVAIGGLIGGTNGMIVGFLFALATNAAAYWFSDKMALAMSGAQPVTPDQAPGLYRMVARLAERANLPMPRVYVIPDGQPNAFATGRNPQNGAVAVTEGLLRLLPPDELEGVIAHELAHIKNRDILVSSVAATIAGAISMVAQMGMFASMLGGGRDEDEGGTNPIVALLGILIAPIAAFLIQMAVSRTREYGADRGGAEICGKPLALANALRRIEAYAHQQPMAVNPAASHMYIINPLGGDGLQRMAALFRTHPLTDERVARLEALAQGRPPRRAAAAA
jgi:heat shock protein HtpX